MLETGPQEVHHDCADVVAVVHPGEQVERKAAACARELNESRKGAENTEAVHSNHQEEGLGDTLVEEFVVHDAALGDLRRRCRTWD